MGSAYRSDKKYTGNENIVISMDIGTTQSAVSFSHLYPGEFPIVQLVTRWPGQESFTGDAKIPTMVAYQDGTAKGFGVEAAGYKDDDEYEVAHWFKLHLHPDTMKESDLPPAYGSNSNRHPLFEIPPLPCGVELRTVYSDFIKYLYDHTRIFFIESTPNGENIWNRLQSKIIVIFCHPNGWDFSQQSFLSDCAVRAGIVAEREVDIRIDFVTEGEASVHYALAYTPSTAWLLPNKMFVVVDAGGSTIDSNLYECKSLIPLKLEEVRRCECIQAGGVFVDRAARQLLGTKLASSAKFGTNEIIDLMIEEYERKTKRLFGSDLSSNAIHFGRNSDNDRTHGILKGRITLTSEEIGSTFDGSVTRTVDSCLKLLRGHKVQHLLLVGGFGESPYLRQRMEAVFHSKGMGVVTVGQPSKKAAAEGGVIWYLKQMVSGRAARFSICTKSSIPFDDRKHEHRRRAHLTFTWDDGVRRIERYEELIERNKILDQNWEVKKDFFTSWKSFPGTIGKYSSSICAWEGDGNPEWASSPEGITPPEMKILCTVEADLKDLISAVVTKHGPWGRYWHLDYSIVMKFGGTKLRAVIRWNDQGVTREGPASIIPGTVY
ncbi:hypothetical protein CPB86DRAFT_746070 [Serendipita vermifera]|nr:hypothetical protein CPB86DRAFT_746070 [Serendipita vermifera]